MRKEVCMFVESHPADPAVHELCVRIARRCVGIVEPLLRQEEVQEAVREFYKACRAEAESMRRPRIGQHFGKEGRS
jgi:hypothetical protein